MHADIGLLSGTEAITDLWYSCIMQCARGLLHFGEQGWGRVLVPKVRCMMFWSCILSFQPTPAVRAAAFTLFGTLSRFGSGPSEGPFFEQIQTNFVSLLLHLNEADPVVVVVCLPSFRTCLRYRLSCYFLLQPLYRPARRLCRNLGH